MSDVPSPAANDRLPREPRPKKRDVHGWLVLDKPVGMTSTHAVAVVKRALNAKKAGHAGTLDPLATGASHALALVWSVDQFRAPALLAQGADEFAAAVPGHESVRGGSLPQHRPDRHHGRGRRLAVEVDESQRHRLLMGGRSVHELRQAQLEVPAVRNTGDAVGEVLRRHPTGPDPLSLRLETFARLPVEAHAL